VITFGGYAIQAPASAIEEFRDDGRLHAEASSQLGRPEIRSEMEHYVVALAAQFRLLALQCDVASDARLLAAIEQHLSVWAHGGHVTIHCASITKPSDG
jgi:hypothetical protein